MTTPCEEPDGEIVVVTGPLMEEAPVYCLVVVEYNGEVEGCDMGVSIMTSPCEEPDGDTVDVIGPDIGEFPVYGLVVVE